MTTNPHLRTPLITVALHLRTCNSRRKGGSSRGSDCHSYDFPHLPPRHREHSRHLPYLTIPPFHHSFTLPPTTETKKKKLKERREGSYPSPRSTVSTPLPKHSLLFVHIVALLKAERMAQQQKEDKEDDGTCCPETTIPLGH